MSDTNMVKEDFSSQGKTITSKPRPYFWRKWTFEDLLRAYIIVAVHILCLLAPFNYKFEALVFGLLLGVVTNFSVAFSYHRNLTHQSFKLPKSLEYFFAYIALFALQSHPIDWVSTHRFHHQFSDMDRDPHSPREGFWFSHVLWIFDTTYMKNKCGKRNNVMDLKEQWFYRFLHKTFVLHIFTFWSIIYYFGGLPYLTCGVGVGGVWAYNGTWIINSAAHTWGSRAWNTKDTSHNIWWLSGVSMGENWHNNHHAFERSARHGLEWWEIDVPWYLVCFLQALGLATDVKLPSQAQKQKMAFAH